MAEELKRISFDESMMIIAQTCALRSTCLRRFVGAVIVDAYRHILSTGYNGVASRVPHCIDHPCPGAFKPSGTGLDSCQAIHAEQNAIAHCRSLSRAYSIYTTTRPCASCTKALLATPVQRIIFLHDYPHDESVLLWESAGRELIKHEVTTTILTRLILDATDISSRLVDGKIRSH